MLRIVTALAATMIGIAAPAAADDAIVTGGLITASDSVLADDLCSAVPVAYDFSLMDPSNSWVMDLKSTSTGGVYEFGNGGDSGTTDAHWCPSDLVGTFTLSGTLVVHDATGEDISSDSVNLTFAVKKRPTKVTLRVTDVAPEAGEIIRAKGCVRSAGHRDTYREIVIQARKPHHKWRRLMVAHTDSVGCFDEATYSKNPDKTYLRTRVPATASQTGAYSQMVTIRAHR